jgi:hypothetical protein
VNDPGQSVAPLIRGAGSRSAGTITSLVAARGLTAGLKPGQIGPIGPLNRTRVRDHCERFGWESVQLWIGRSHLRKPGDGPSSSLCSIQPFLSNRNLTKTAKCCCV